jgi:hypothetical protein
MRRGTFVDCWFPFAEHPALPAPVRHIVYVQTRLRLKSGASRLVVMLTTTSPKMIEAIPPGLSVTVTKDSSMRMGMRNAFTIDIHRLAVLPPEPEWFPDIGSEDFIIAYADDHLQQAITKRYDQMLEQHPIPAIRLGPEFSGN